MQRLMDLMDPCVTLKLDGTRTLIVRERGEWQAHTLISAKVIQGQPCVSTASASKFSALDAEFVHGHYYVFDTLFVDGVDVRHLPLRARLREARTCLPSCASMKRYFWADATDSSLGNVVKRLAHCNPKLVDGTVVDPIEGFIFLSASAPYDATPLKFKFEMTYDFAVVPSENRLSAASDLSNQNGNIGTAGTVAVVAFDLFALASQKLLRFKPAGDTPATLELTRLQCQQLEVPTIDSELTLDSCVILELKLVGCLWLLVRRRFDRRRPNAMRNILENLQLQRSGKCDPRFLLQHLVPTQTPHHATVLVKDAMLRSVGTCAAIVAKEVTVALFMPSRRTLQFELDSLAATHQEAALAIVAPGLTAPICQAQPASDPSNPDAQDPTDPPLPLAELLLCAREWGWGCRPLPSIRPSDFIVGNLALPGDLHKCFLDVTFLVLRRKVSASKSMIVSVADASKTA